VPAQEAGRELRGFLQKMVKSENSKIGIVTLSLRTDCPSAFKINNFKKRQSSPQIWRPANITVLTKKVRTKKIKETKTQNIKFFT
jgi:hypothetical protein